MISVSYMKGVSGYQGPLVWPRLLWAVGGVLTVVVLLWFFVFARERRALEFDIIPEDSDVRKMGGVQGQRYIESP